METKTLYDVIGLTRNATASEIKSAYRMLAREYHPDGTVRDPQRVERFKEIASAYAILGDADKRAAYDKANDDLILSTDIATTLERRIRSNLGV